MGDFTVTGGNRCLTLSLRGFGAGKAKREHEKATAKDRVGHLMVFLLSWNVCQRGPLRGCPDSPLIARKNAHDWVDLQCCGVSIVQTDARVRMRERAAVRLNENDPEGVEAASCYEMERIRYGRWK